MVLLVLEPFSFGLQTAGLKSLAWFRIARLRVSELRKMERPSHISCVMFCFTTDGKSSRKSVISKV